MSSASLASTVQELQRSVERLTETPSPAVNKAGIEKMVQEAVEEAEKFKVAREELEKERVRGASVIVKAPHLETSQRPDTIQEAVRFKFNDARRQSRWEMDSAANYDFSGVRGTAVVKGVIAQKKRAKAKGFSMLDVGAGKGDFLYGVEELARARGVEDLYLRGVTAGYERNANTSEDRTACCCYGEDGPGESGRTVKVYHQFPLEDIAACHESDFIAEGRKFDVIIASWTMLHLADPLGTLVQLYPLLVQGGVILGNFCYAHIGDGEKSRLKEAIAHMGEEYQFFYEAAADKGLLEGDTVCIRRTTKEELALPVNYTEGTIGHVWMTVQAQYYVAHYELADGVPAVADAGQQGGLLQFLGMEAEAELAVKVKSEVSICEDLHVV